MSLVIRSARVGKKGERKFRIVVKEKRSRRDGESIETLGWYEKGKNGGKEINKERMFSEYIHKIILPQLLQFFFYQFLEWHHL
jgi:ribosomal protein S16